MWVFIDESGDTGFKLDRGSTKNFVVACIIFNNRLDVEETSLTIKRLKERLGKTERWEFKFSKCSHEERIQFLEAVANSKFKYRCIVIAKERIYSTQLINNKATFYNFIIKQLLEKSHGDIHDAVIYIDSRGERLFKRKTATYLRKHVNAGDKIIRDIKFRDSKRNILIQLADMVAGAVNRSYGSKRDCGVYRNIIENREQDVWDFK